MVGLDQPYLPAEPLYESPADFFCIFPKEQRNEQMELLIQHDEARKIKRELVDDGVRTELGW